MELSNQRTLVVGASRGLGRGVATKLAAAGADVLAISRSLPTFDGVRKRAGDATDPTFVSHVLAQETPSVLVLVAGAQPAMNPLSQYDWEAFSQCWNVDVKATFHWLKEALNRRMEGRIIVFSSGAAIHGSPLSGGYAGAKQTQRFLCKYARDAITKSNLDLRIQTVLPQLNPNTDLGRAGIAAYASAAGESTEAFVEKRFGDPLSPDKAGEAIVRLLTETDFDGGHEFVLTGGGLKAL